MDKLKHRFWDSLINRNIKQLFRDTSCGLIIGDRGTGKSTLFSLIARESNLDELKVYSNYPMENTFSIPQIVTVKKDGSKRIRLDKDWLYSTDLSNSVILIDEARTVWNARSYNDWTMQDEEFFNMIRHYNTFVWLASQVYDGVDLNCRRAVEYTFFLQKIVHFPLFTRNICSCEVNRSLQVKTEDRNYHIVSRGFSKNALLTNWNIGEVPISRCYFYRRSYYGLFNSYYTDDSKVIREPILWDSLLNPDSPSPPPPLSTSSSQSEEQIKTD